MSSPLRILIVDDDLRQGEAVAKAINLTGTLKLRIGLTNNAYFVARRLNEATKAEHVPWDIIIADVYMPRPVRARTPNAATDETPEESTDSSFTWWKSHLIESGTESPEHGGLHIANTIKRLKREKDWWKLMRLKLVVISSKLDEPTRTRLLPEIYLGEVSGILDVQKWFIYLDKSGDVKDGSGARLPPRLFEQAIESCVVDWDNEYWGDAVFRDLGKSEPFFVSSNTFRTVLLHVIAVVRDFERRGEAPRVLLCGERGTGKEFLARLMHRQVLGGVWVAESFVDVSCPGTVPTLFESLLFGYAQGAFPGALSHGAEGFVHRAANGTLFLDEIGDLPLDVQPKLLRFISELKFQRVGCTRTEDFRGKLVVAATERPRENVRESLRDRFNSFTIPPLRERREEILPMAQSMLAHLNRGRRQPSDLLGEAEHFISEQDWRGNARQLFKTLQKAATAYDEITADVLRECLDAEPSGRSVPPSVDGSKTETPESVRRFEDISPEDLVAHGVKWSDLPKGSSTIVRKVVLVICADALVKQRGLQQKAWAESLGTTAGNLLATISSLKGRVTNGDVTLASLKELLGRIVHEARYEELYAAALTDFVNNAKLTSERQLRPPRRLSSSVLLQP